MSDSYLDGVEARERTRRAKIVCTIGPASQSEAMIRELMRAGMDVARLNFSHGTHDDQAKVIERLRRAAQKEDRSICILQDLQGPKIRTDRLKYRTPVALRKGTRVTITPRDLSGTESLISTSFETLAENVQPGSRVLLSDGLIELRVTAVKGKDVECEVVNGGKLGEHQGINLPGTPLNIPAMTDKDREDLQFGLEQKVDVVALSFVRRASDVREIKHIIHRHGSDTPVIAKLEKPQAIENLDDIFDISDGVMVARGDLGVEMLPEQVPIIQKQIIARSAEWRKPVITATQMLESMVENPRPTRAEASDVANAIFDGSDAVMLSGETARGKYPRQAVEMMARIICEAESHFQHRPWMKHSRDRRLSVAETICESVAHAADDLTMRAIAVFTETGTTARLVSKYRPRCPVFGFADSQRVCNRLNLLWGVHPHCVGAANSIVEMVKSGEQQMLQHGSVTAGDVVGIVTGTRQSAGFTNLMWLHTVGGEQAQHVPERRTKPRTGPASKRKPQARSAEE